MSGNLPTFSRQWLSADEDLDNRVLEGLRERVPGVDLRHVRSDGLGGRPDAEILAWAAERGRIVITSDVNTMTKAANERVQVGLSMPGVILVPQTASIGLVIDELAVIAEAGTPGDFENQCTYLPW